MKTMLSTMNMPVFENYNYNYNNCSVSLVFRETCGLVETNKDIEDKIEEEELPVS